MNEAMILAAKSASVRRVLENAGIAVEIMTADLDDRALEAPLADTGASAEDMALVVAEAKATDVSGRRLGEMVLVCEQVLSLGDEPVERPGSQGLFSSKAEENRRCRTSIAGRTRQ